VEEYNFQVKQFVDLSNPYSHRLRDLSSYLKIDLQGVSRSVLLQKLGSSFVRIYTEYNTVIVSFPGYLLTLLLPFITLSSAVIFGLSHKHGYKEEDVKVTYIVLWTVVYNLAIVFARVYLSLGLWGSYMVHYGCATQPRNLLRSKKKAHSVEEVLCRHGFQ
jgi:hypothetical protein